MTDDIHRCSLCGVAFKPDDVCSDDITEGTCHAGCLEGSPVVDLETGDEMPGGKVGTYRYSEVTEQQILDESGKGAWFELAPEAIVAALTIPPPQPQMPVVDLLPIYAEGGIGARLMEAMEAYRKDYVFSPDDGWDHNPTEFEKVMLEDFLNGAFNEQVTAILQKAARAAVPPAPPPQDHLTGHSLTSPSHNKNSRLGDQNDDRPKDSLACPRDGSCVCGNDHSTPDVWQLRHGGQDGHDWIYGDPARVAFGDFSSGAFPGSVLSAALLPRQDVTGEPTGYLVKRYDLDGVLLDTELSFTKPVIHSTSKTEFVPLFASPAPQGHGPVEPDYCFDPDDWEFTCDWTDRDQVHGHGDALTRSDPMRVCTLMKGPDKWVADVPVTWNENGDPEDTEIRWFDSEAEARAALTATTEGQP